MNFDSFLPTSITAFCTARDRRITDWLCSFVDHNVGLVLKAIADADLDGVALRSLPSTSDHGELLGDHGLWQKSYMYEGSVGVPLVVAGPGLPRDHTVKTPVSLLDLYPTMVEELGVANPVAAEKLPGVSLRRLCMEPDQDRIVLSEYHDYGSITGMFMVRWKQWKLVYYVGYPSQLFDLDSDPGEMIDVGQSDCHAAIRRQCEAHLRSIVDPEHADMQAFADQQRLIAELGGEDKVRSWPELARTPMPDVASDQPLRDSV